MRRRSAGADEHPGGSAQTHAMFAALLTGRLAPNRALLIAEGDAQFRVALIAEMREHPG